MATSSIHSELTCSVCLELYKDPLQLKCMHSFCRHCLHQISNTNPAKEEDAMNICNSEQQKLFDQQAGKVFECPDCRYIVTLGEDGIDGLPKNFTLRNIVENLKKNDVGKTKPQFPCAVCTEEPPREGVKFCRQCCICYCEVCLGQLHPERGVLSKHILVTPSKKAISSLTENEKTVAKSESDTKRFWCRTCRSEYSNTGIYVKKHSEHDTITVKEAKLQMMTEMEKKALDLEQTKRRFSDMVANADDSIKQFEEDVQRRVLEIKNCSDKMREQILNSISAKEREYLNTLKEDAVSKIEKRHSQINTGKQHLTEIRHLLRDIGATFEESDDTIFLKKMSEIEEKVHKVQRQKIQIDRDKFKVSSDALSKLTKSLETLQLQSVKTGNADGMKDRKVDKSSESSENINSPVRIITVETIPCNSFAVVGLTWTEVPGHTVDIHLSSVTKEGHQTAYFIYDVPGNRILVDKLEFDVNYSASVSVHDQPHMESKPHKFRTLPWINCPEFSLDQQKAHRSIRFSNCGKKCVHENAEDWYCNVFDEFCGTVGVYEIESGHMYWEVKAKFKIPNKNKHYVFDLGICDENKVDRVADLWRNYHSYACSLVKRGKRRDMDLEFSTEGKVHDGIIHTFSNIESIHLGFFLNIDKKEFIIIDPENNVVYYTFKDIKRNRVYVPAFGLVAWDYDTELTLLTGSSLTGLPNVLGSLIMH